MFYNKFKELNLSKLGFGTMRLPVLTGKTAADIDYEQTEKIIDYAVENGVNYFDTAYVYHGGMSEVVVAEILKKYPRESYYLATKYPGHSISDSYNPSEIFEEQLEKCKVDYFDFYLLHNVYEESMSVYTDPKWGIIEYFIKQKKLGRIKHLGFSSHGRIGNLREFLDLYGNEMEFCQIQLNYLDWTLQNAKEKYDLLTERNIPIWVMEPVRGGKLAYFDEKTEAELRNLRPDESIASWAFRWLNTLPNVKMILSGMSDINQVVDNIKTFSTDIPLSDHESKLLLKIADDKLKSFVPCTACRYCCDSCPMGLDIPMFINIYNDISFDAKFTPAMVLEFADPEKRPEACIACGACAKMCPQKIEIPQVLKELSKKLDSVPKWRDICKERNELAKRNK